MGFVGFFRREVEDNFQTRMPMAICTHLEPLRPDALGQDELGNVRGETALCWVTGKERMVCENDLGRPEEESQNRQW